MSHLTALMSTRLAVTPLTELPHVLLAVAAYGVLGIALTILGFKLFDWALPRVDIEKELAERNVAVAIVAAAALLGVAAVIVAAVAP